MVASAKSSEQQSTQTKHTPGPWRVEPMRARGKYAGCIQVAPADGPAHVFLGQGRDDIQAANARLIAAAPELLAALKAIEMETREGGQWTPAEINEVARAAIAKAEGK